jgi:hypothetical protein
MSAPRLRTLAALAAVAVVGTGCAGLTAVEPWRKGDLARPEMGFEARALEARMADQVYTSREAASGGQGVGGGGCGCN